VRDSLFDVFFEDVETCSESELLHNMSSPPKSKMTVQPLRSADTRVMAGSIQSATCSSGGLSWVMRIDLDKLIQAYLPTYEAWMADGQVNPGGASAEPRHPDSPARMALTGDHHLRLRCLLAIAQVTAGEIASLTVEHVEALRDLPHEVLCDRLRTISAGIDPSPLQLPALGMATPPDRIDRTCEMAPSRVFYAMSRLSGNTFVRGASAMVAGIVHRNIVRDLWIPA